MFSLLPNKYKNTYNKLFEQLFQLINNIGNGPNDVLVDFERRAMNAFQNRNIEVQGCFYHLSANIWKHAPHLGESQRYNQEEEFALHTRMLPVLSFLAAGNVIEGFEELKDTIRMLYDDVADDLFQHFKDTYISRYRRNAPRHPPLFAINLWNMFSACYPLFWKFLFVLQKEKNMIRISIVQHLAGLPVPPSRQRYLDLSRRILRILDDCPNCQRFQYLRAIAQKLFKNSQH